MSQGHPTTRLCKFLPSLREYVKYCLWGPAPEPEQEPLSTKGEVLSPNTARTRPVPSHMIVCGPCEDETAIGTSRRRLVTSSTHDRPAGRAISSADVRIVRTNKRHDRSTCELISRVANDRESSRRREYAPCGHTVQRLPTRPARPPTFTRQPLQPNTQKPGPGPYLARPLEISWLI